MKRVLIGELGAIVKLGLRQLIESDRGCQLVGGSAGTLDLFTELRTEQPDVVLLELDDTCASTDLATTISRSHPSIKVIACSSSVPRMQVFPRHGNGESYVARMSVDRLIEAVKQN